MSDKEKKFHNFALQSSLFKGHSDWYFCYLKSERIAHVIEVVSEAAGATSEKLAEVREHAATLPTSIAYLASGDVELKQVLAEIFSIVVSIRLLITTKVIALETGRTLVEEYYAVAEKIDAAARLSPFVTSEDFYVHTSEDTQPTRSVGSELRNRLGISSENIKDNPKGQPVTDGRKEIKSEQAQHPRSQLILDFVLSRKGVSIKDISSVVKDCSEKTIQRELGELIKRGQIRKVGERRWSLYEPIE